MIRMVIVVLVTVFAAPAWATTYFVSKTGNNANSCATAQGSGASAKLTITNALANCIQSGDTLTVQAGTYQESLSELLGVTIASGGGTDLTRTVLQCEGDRTCAITPTNITHWSFVLWQANTSWITIKNFVLGRGIHLGSSTRPSVDYPHHIKVEN